MKKSIEKLDGLAIKGAELLNGLTLSEAEIVLDKVRLLLSLAIRVDVDSKGFKEQVADFVSYYGVGKTETRQ